MGVVYEAVDQEHGARVALKLLSRMDAEGLVRFKREFRSLQGIRHANLVGLRELIEHEGQWFFTMDLVDGSDAFRYFQTGPGFSEYSATDEAITRTSADIATATSPTTDSANENVAGVRRLRPLPRSRVRDLKLVAADVVRGLQALHAKHKVHRDVKPSNILVAPKERKAFVADFGIVTDTREVRAPRLIGTAAYMAPEQVNGEATPAADWYALGATLYRLLTGRLPFEGSPAEILEAKTHGTPTPIETWGPPVDGDLASLCMEMLSRDPSSRPDGQSVLGRLGFRGSAPNQLRGNRRSFVGRVEELSALTDAFSGSRHGPTIAIVEGPSGIGKSALIREFVHRVTHSHPAASVFLGRCYENESVPYKAFDAAIDALSTHLLGREDYSKFVPEDAPLLGRAFPTMQRLPEFSTQNEGVAAIDVHEVRTRGFLALRTLLWRLSIDAPVIIAIDDLQWADTDSLALLRFLCAGEDAPRLLLVGSVRTGIENSGGVLLPRDIEEVSPCPVVSVSVASMTRDDAATLAQRLALGTGAARSTIDLQGIADAADGHPLFIETLLAHQRDAQQEATLDEVLWNNVASLSATMRKPLEILAVAGSPLPQEILAQASGLSLDEFGHVSAALSHEKLVQVSGARRSDLIETYHDRVRETIVAHLAEESRREIHRRIASAIEVAYRRDSEKLARHWAGAGEYGRALKHAVRAAEDAADSFAFDRAVTMFETALRLQERVGAESRELRVRLANALRDAGRGPAAAEQYLRACEDAEVRDAVEMNLKAAEQYLRSGYFDQGIDVLTRALPLVGEEYPETPKRALMSIVGNMVRLRVRGFRYKPQKASTIAADTLLRVDTLAAVSTALSMVDPVRGRCFGLRRLHRALDAGEPLRLATAIANEVPHAASSGGPKSEAAAAKLLQLIDALGERIEDERTLGYIEFAHAAVAYLRGRWQEVVRAIGRSRRYFERTPGASFELHALDSWLCNTLANMGDLRRVGEILPSKLRTAEERGDLYGVALYRASYASVVLLAQDRVDDLMASLDVVRSQWTPHGFHLQHWYELHSRVQAWLYLGDLESATNELERGRHTLEKSMLMRLETIRGAWLVLRSRVDLMRSSAEPQQRRKLAARILKRTRELDRTTLAWGNAWSRLLAAGTAELRGDLASAIAGYEQGAAAAGAAHMRALEAAANWRLGEVAADDVHRLAAAEYFAEQGVVEPDRFAFMLLPVRRS